ncbi:MAG: PQQ-binding-like beta-propeller repeat protein [Pseudomonadota bacterium]
MRNFHKILLGCAVLAAAGCTTNPPGSSSSGGSGASADWPTFGGSNARNNSNLAPTKITAANVGSLVKMQVKVSSPIDAGLIYLKGAKVNGASHDVFFGTTNMGRTVAIDANAGTVLWEYTSPGFDEAKAFAGAPIPMGLIIKQITNSTPVADANRQFVYAASADGKVTKISIADGKSVWSTSVTKLPNFEKLDSPLTFLNGKVIVSTAGYVGDTAPYQGHIAVLDAKTGALEHVWNSLCSDRAELLEPKACPTAQSAIWGRAGVVVEPSTGNLMFATGNGPWDGKTNWGDALIALNSNATQIVANWTPTNNEELNKKDLDVGSTTPALLGDGYYAQGGKDGTVRVVHFDNIKGSAPHQGGEVQIVEVPGKNQMSAAPAVAKVNGKTWLFVSAAGRGGGGTTAWTFGADHKLTEAWKSTTGGTSPFYAGGLLYVYSATGQAKLSVLDATTGNVVTTLEAAAGHWNSPIVVDNRIALPEGAIPGFGGRPPAPGAAAPPPAPTSPQAGIVNIWHLP